MDQVVKILQIQGIIFGRSHGMYMGMVSGLALAHVSSIVASPLSTIASPSSAISSPLSIVLYRRMVIIALPLSLSNHRIT